mgnify:CR=1 FL=1
MAETDTLTYRRSEAVATQKVLRNTYMLLSITLRWTAAMAGVSMALEVPPMGFIPLLVAFGVLFAISKFRNSGVGIVLVFVFTGILGFSLGPIISLYIAAGASQIVVTAASLTGLIFLSLSGYTLMSQKDFSFMTGFLSVGLWVMLGCVLLLWLGPLFGFYSSALHLAISAGIVILMSGLILYDTSRIIHGGETNYVMATVSLYLSIYNIFISLLHIFGLFGGDE